MSFLCLDCKTATMVPANLDIDLSADECSKCHGHWITSARYFSFSASQESARVTSPTTAAGDSSGRLEARTTILTDSSSAKFCPACARFMHYYPVGHGLAFGIDKCNTCGGVWLNAGEWDALKECRMHLQLHAISDDTWQERVRTQRRAQSERTLLMKIIGPADLAEADRIRHWLSTHPRRPSLMAYLQNPAGI